MVPDLRRQHPDAACLLAWADGELRPWQSWRVSRHMKSCWQCRGRISEVEAAIRAVSQTLAPVDVSPVDLARAKWMFRAAATIIEPELPAKRQVPFLKVAVAAGAAALCIGLFSWTAPAGREVSADSLLSAAISAETASVQAAVQEDRYTVEHQIAGTGAASRRELRLLAAPTQGNWTARWSDEGGGLRNAVFASERSPGAEFTSTAGLQPAIFRRPASHRGLVEYAADSPGEVDRMVLGWIRQQVWRQVSLAREVSQFCTRSGAVLKVSAARGTVLWTAAATIDGVRFEVQLEGLQNQRPRVLQITWHSRRGDGMLRVKHGGRSEYRDVGMAAALLYPPAILHRPAKAPRAAAPELKILERVYPPKRSLIAAEVEVLRTVHSARLCRADQLQVVRAIDAVVVSGSFGRADTVTRIAGLLSGIPDVRLQLTIMPPEVMGVTGFARETISDKPIRPAAAEPWLRARLGVGERTSEREMFNTMNAVVRDSEELLSHSWALFHLAQRFSPDVEGDLDAESRAKLHGIVDDHVIALRVHLAAVDGRLALQQTSSSPVPSASPWQKGAEGLHEDVKRMADLLLSLFASSDSASRAAAFAGPEESGLGALIGRVRSQTAALRGSLTEEMRFARQQ